MAGCLDGSSTDQESIPATIELRSSYRYGVNDDGIGVKTSDYDQFVFITPPDSAGDLAPSAYHLDVGDEQYRPARLVPGLGSRTHSIEEIYTEENKSGSLMFDLPTTETESASLQYDGTSYPLSEDARTQLATAPDFSLDSVLIPEAVGPNENVELTVTVTNDGDAAGTYLAGCRVAGLPRDINVPVEAGETKSGSVTFQPPPDSDAMYLNFVYPGGDREYEVTIETEQTAGQS
jgi:hypothetical protein